MLIKFSARFVGVYLLLAAAYQFIIFRPAFETHQVLWPRVGLLLFGDAPYRLSEVWLFFLAVALITMPKRRTLLVFYVISEIALSLPTILLMAGSIFSDIGHMGIGPRELVTVVTVFLVFGVIPCCVAIAILKNVTNANQIAGVDAQ